MRPCRCACYLSRPEHAKPAAKAYVVATGLTSFRLSQVQVELKKGETLMINAALSLPASSLHKAFSDRSGVPLDFFELYYRGKVLKGEAALASWGVVKDSSIEVKMRGRGGSRNKSGKEPMRQAAPPHSQAANTGPSSSSASPASSQSQVEADERLRKNLSDGSEAAAAAEKVTTAAEKAMEEEAAQEPPLTKEDEEEAKTAAKEDEEAKEKEAKDRRRRIEGGLDLIDKVYSRLEEEKNSGSSWLSIPGRLLGMPGRLLGWASPSAAANKPAALPEDPETEMAPETLGRAAEVTSAAEAAEAAKVSTARSLRPWIQQRHSSLGTPPLTRISVPLLLVTVERLICSAMPLNLSTA